MIRLSFCGTEEFVNELPRLATEYRERRPSAPPIARITESWEYFRNSNVPGHCRVKLYATMVGTADGYAPAVVELVLYVGETDELGGASKEKLTARLDKLKAGVTGPLKEHGFVIMGGRLETGL